MKNLARVAVATVSVLAAATAGLASAHAATPARTDGLGRFYAQQVTWTPCGKDLECGTVTVPLDYRKPGGMTIDLAVNRLMTAGEAAPSLLVNPGGPGASGVAFVKVAGATLFAPASTSVQAAYNLVGFDPRGVGASLPLVCTTQENINTEAQTVPTTSAQAAVAAKDAAALGRRCIAVGKGLVSNIGTEMVARDMDIIRAAVGSPKLNYLGMSYGTYLGSTYAHLFPGHVGRMVLDSVEDPTIGFENLIKAQAAGFEDSLHGWAAACATRPLCSALAPGKTADELVALVTAQSQQLAATPLPVPGKAPITQANYLAMAQNALSSGEVTGGWTLLDGVVYSIATGDGSTIAGYRDGTTPTPNLLSANVANQCYDRPVAGTTATSVAWAKQWGKAAPVFGPTFGWGAQPCFTWPVRQNQPDLDATPRTKAPVLLIGGTHDPNTPYWMAKKTARMYPNGRLLTWDGYGHVSANRFVPCINDAAAAYLVNGTLPAAGTVCAVNLAG